MLYQVNEQSNQNYDNTKYLITTPEKLLWREKKITLIALYFFGYYYEYKYK